MPNLTTLVTTTSPTLTSGAFSVTVGEFGKVIDAHVSFDDPLTNDFVFAAVITSISTNVVTVHLYKQQVSATNTWGDAETADFSGKKVVVKVSGV